MSDTLNITVGADLGLSYKGVSAKLSTTISKTLQTTESFTNTSLTEETATRELSNSSLTKNMKVAIYNEMIEYSLFRTDGSLVTSPWKVLNPKNEEKKVYLY